MAFPSLTNGTFCSNYWHQLLQEHSFTFRDSDFALLVTPFTQDTLSRRISHTSSVKAALAHARREWPVFPLHTPTPRGCSCRTFTSTSVGKHPRTPHGFKDATVDDAQIRRRWQQWPQANIGVWIRTIKCKFLYHLAERTSKIPSTFRKLLFLPTGLYRRMDVPRIITIANNKGGTGKTTTAVNLSAGLAFQKGYRVLLVDFDPQGNASISLDIDIENLKHSVKDLLGNTAYPTQNLLWKKGETLRILPANNTLKDIEPELLGSVDGRLRLRARLTPIVAEFDFVIIDTPPTTGIFTQAPLIASHEVLIPVDVGYFSLQGVRQLLEEIAKVREHFNQGLQIAGILLTKFDSRTTFSTQVEKTLRSSFGDLAMKTMIRINIDLVRSQVDRQSIFAFDPNSAGAKDYQSLVDELVGNVVSFPQERKRRMASGV